MTTDTTRHPPTTAICIPRTLVNRLLYAAQQAASAEICGLIGARAGIPGHCYPVANIAAEPASRYEMDPKGQIDALRLMRERGEELFAIYHSHPSSPAVPSAIDRDAASYPDALYLIVSLVTKGVLDLRGYYIRDKAALPVELEIG
jgi:proteasome lid subunit RPN8/RPN11